MSAVVERQEAGVLARGGRNDLRAGAASWAVPPMVLRFRKAIDPGGSKTERQTEESGR